MVDLTRVKPIGNHHFEDQWPYRSHRDLLLPRVNLKDSHVWVELTQLRATNLGGYLCLNLNLRLEAAVTVILLKFDDLSDADNANGLHLRSFYYASPKANVWRSDQGPGTDRRPDSLDTQGGLHEPLQRGFREVTVRMH